MSSKVELKDGKVPLSDRDKYRRLSTEAGDVLSVPPTLEKAFEDAGLASKWVSKAKIAKHGGYHPSNWIPYEISDSLKETLPKLFLGNVVSSHLERGDLILAVKPMELHIEHRKNLERKTRQQLDSFYEEVDASGKRIMRDE